MSSPSESAVPSPTKPVTAIVPDRRTDIDLKQAQIAALLAELEIEGLFLFEPENFSWFTAGATPRGVLDPNQLPVLFLAGEVRCVLASNVDSQRLFDEELDGLGFQLKEWSWHVGRDPLISYLCRGRKLGCDRPLPECKPVGDALRRLRRPITGYEVTGYRQLGQLVSHALEATCRQMAVKQTEQEIAGHLSHRVLKHGAELVSVEVAADDRLRRFRRVAYTDAAVNRQCAITATVRQAGLHATASRVVSFGPVDEALHREHDAACKITASYIAASWPDALPGKLLQAGKRVYQINGAEHDWRHYPAGYLTGRAAVDQVLTAQTAEPIQPGWAITWQALLGGTISCDTFVVTPKGPLMLTAPGQWPKKRIRIHGANFDRPDILQRGAGT
ncbi:MAG: hypothetical protein JNM56_23885 [Planctomycetia bacterium]|nr:hypothetical protein [Planctomycetia bacterium]